MIKEKKFFDEALEFMGENYNTDWDKLGERLPQVCSKYSSPLWGKLILSVVEHLEAKAKYEARRHI